MEDDHRPLVRNCPPSGLGVIHNPPLSLASARAPPLNLQVFRHLELALKVCSLRPQAQTISQRGNPMELRALVEEEEREVFGLRLSEARARLGMKFRERPRSLHAKIQLKFANLYGVFARAEDPAEKMLAGLAMHDLEMFPQSCTRPDLTDLPSGSVFEISDHWSLSNGAGLLAWCGASVVVGLRNAQAVLAYLPVKEMSNTSLYTATGFVRCGEPVRYPYVETLDGGEVFVQPVVVQGGPLRGLFAAMAKCSRVSRGVREKITFLSPSAEQAATGLCEFSTKEVASVVRAFARDQRATVSNENSSLASFRREHSVASAFGIGTP
jgi:hypothetical protein